MVTAKAFIGDNNIRKQLLKDWDIDFVINGEVLVNILGFCEKINTDMPFIFLEDRIYIQLKSSDNIQVTEVFIKMKENGDQYVTGLTALPSDPKVISDSVLTILDPSVVHTIEKEEEEEEVDPNSFDNEDDSYNGNKSSEDEKSPVTFVSSVDYGKPQIQSITGECKCIFVDMKRVVFELKKHAEKDDIIKVRIDTKVKRRIEFHCPNAVIAAHFIKVTDNHMESIYRLHNTIARVRLNENLEVATAIIENDAFNKMVFSGTSKYRDVDVRVFITIDPDVGLTVSYGDKLKSRIFEISRFEGKTMLVEDYIRNEFASETKKKKDKKLEELELKHGQTRKHGQTILEDTLKENKQWKYALALTANIPQTIMIDMKFIFPFVFKDVRPIRIEIRNDKPIVIHRFPYNGVDIMFTVAPRIEDEDEDAAANKFTYVNANIEIPKKESEKDEEEVEGYNQLDEVTEPISEEEIDEHILEGHFNN